MALTDAELQVGRMQNSATPPSVITAAETLHSVAAGCQSRDSRGIVKADLYYCITASDNIVRDRLLPPATALLLAGWHGEDL